MTFRTQYSRVSYNCIPGDKVVPIYGYVKDKDTGENVLKVIGEKDQYAEIQSFKDSVDLNLIIKRFQNGDESALNAVQTFYADCDDLPHSLREVYDLANGLSDKFAALDPTEREKYGDPLAWLEGLYQAAAEPQSAVEPVSVSAAESEGKEV